MAATTKKKCDVTYSMCQEGPDQMARSNLTYDATISVILKIESSIQSLCYTVYAISGNSTIEINGRYGMSLIYNISVIIIVITYSTSSKNLGTKKYFVWALPNI